MTPPRNCGWAALLSLLTVGIVGCETPPGSFHPTEFQVTQEGINQGFYSSAMLFAVGELVFDRPRTCGQGGGLRKNGVCVYDRLAGPEAQTCLECHNQPLSDGAGGLISNVFRFIDNQSMQMIERNSPHIFGVGYVELLAREMTKELQSQRAQAVSFAKSSGGPTKILLSAKGLDFGELRAMPDGTTQYLGTAVQEDLIVRPFMAKGVASTIREQNIGAIVGHLGIQPTELVGVGTDPDGDGVVDEMSVGQVSALVAYEAMLPVPSFVPFDNTAEAGAQRFKEVGCSSCHTPYLRLEDPRFFLADPTSKSPAVGMTLDLPLDGQEPRGFRLGQIGPVLVPLFSDLRRHDIGPALADYRDVPILSSPLAPVPDVGSPELATLPIIPASFFLSTRLWGVGSTGPYLHHGRATDLDQAVRAHAGEATESRQSYEKLDESARASLLAFLKSLVLRRISGSATAPPEAAGGS